MIVRASVGHGEDLDNRLRGLGCAVYCRLPLINSVAIRVPVARLKSLADMQSVARISEDVVTTKHDEFTVGSTGEDVAFQNGGLQGTGLTVAIIDSGINHHRDLRRVDSTNRILADVSFVPGSPGTDDLCGHGTHVAAIAAGNGAASSGGSCFRQFLGIARGANLVNVRVLDADGHGLVSSVISGIQWCIQNKSVYNIRVINLSLGHAPGESYTTDPLCQAAEQAGMPVSWWLGCRAMVDD